MLFPCRFVALRSSLIFGPEPPLAPVGRPLFLQFVRQVLEAGEDTTFFVDEYRYLDTPAAAAAAKCQGVQGLVRSSRQIVLLGCLATVAVLLLLALGCGTRACGWWCLIIMTGRH